MFRRITLCAVLALLAGPWFLQAQEITGTWRGSYVCGQGETGLDLQISGSPSALTAVFTFYPLDNPAEVTGVFRMRGQLGADNTLQLNAERWIQRPPLYEMVDLDGIVSGSGFAGRVTGVAGCKMFRVDRIAATGEAAPAPSPGGPRAYKASGGIPGKSHSCGNTVFLTRPRACPDGSIPVFHGQPVLPRSSARDRNVARSPAQEENTAYNEPSDTGVPSSLFGMFGLTVKGAVWQTENSYTGERWLHVSPPVGTKGVLQISRDGTYKWNSSWDQRLITGRWTTNRQGLVLLNAQEKKNWFVTPQNGATGATIWVFDNKYVIYDGTPIR